KLPVRSFITSVMAGDTLPVATSVQLKGIAFDGGTGIRQVEVSLDSGRTWAAAALGENLGRFSFREWRLPATFASKGDVTLMVRATSNGGEVQPMEAGWNPGGYMRNVVEATRVTIV
ncbi:MAG: hypothetical protein KDI09_18580, partial [Halioglobus sp.]|nr:hypothetical protein [Halioglobus sp.]